MHDLVAELYLLDHEPGARRQQHLRIHRPPLGWPDDPSGRRGLPEYSGVVQLARANLDISPPQPGWPRHVCTGIASRLVNSMTTTGLLHEIRSRTAFHGRHGARRGSPANPVKVSRAEPTRTEGRELSLDRGCEPGVVATSRARIR